MTHKFGIGQNVVFNGRLPGTMIADGAFEIVRQLPPDVTGEPQYRVKSPRESHERVVGESQLRGEAGVSGVWSAAFRTHPL